MWAYDGWVGLCMGLRWVSGTVYGLTMDQWDCIWAKDGWVGLYMGLRWLSGTVYGLTMGERDCMTVAWHSDAFNGVRPPEPLLASFRHFLPALPEVTCPVLTPTDITSNNPIRTVSACTSPPDANMRHPICRPGVCVMRSLRKEIRFVYEWQDFALPLTFQSAAPPTNIWYVDYIKRRLPVRAR
jgi:hypothetical protein